MTKKVKQEAKETAENVAQAAKKGAKKVEQVADSVIDTAQGVFEKQNIVNALSYIPVFIGPVLMFFLAKADKKKTMHHIKYALIIAVIYVVLTFLLNDFVKSLVSIAYLAISAYFAYQAYEGKDIKVEVFDSIEEKIQEKVKK